MGDIRFTFNKITDHLINTVRKIAQAGVDDIEYILEDTGKNSSAVQGTGIRDISSSNTDWREGAWNQDVLDFLRLPMDSGSPVVIRI